MKGIQDTAARDRLLTALRSGATIDDACAAAGMDRRVAYRWRERDARVEAAWPTRRRADQMRGAASEDVDDVSFALEQLRRIAKGDGSPAVAAAKAILARADAVAQREAAAKPTPMAPRSKASAVPLAAAHGALRVL